MYIYVCTIRMYMYTCQILCLNNLTNATVTLLMKTATFPESQLMLKFPQARFGKITK